MHAIRPEAGHASSEAGALIEHLPVGLFRARVGMGGTLHIASLNAEARRILGLETDDWVLVGPEGFPGPGIDEVAAIARRQHEQPGRSSWTGDIVAATGVRTIEASTTPVGRDGDDILLQGYVLDVTERRRAERATERLVSELADAQRIGRIGSWLFLPGDRNSWSDEMYRIHGLAPGTPIPDDAEWYAQFLAPAAFARLQEVTARGMRDAIGYEVAYELHRPDGTTRHVLSRGAPLLSADGSVLGVQGTTVDITDLVTARTALEAREAELAEAQHAAKVGSWMTTVDGGNAWSDEMCRIHGIEPGETVPDFDGYLERFRPGPGVTAARRRMAETMRTGIPYEAEYTVTRPDGETVTLLARGSPMRDPDGVILGLRGSCMDITELARAREALAASERLHRTLVGALAEAVIVQDLEGRIVTANPAAERILGLRLDQLTGLTSMDPRWEALHEDGTPVPGAEHPAMITLATGAPVRDAVMQIAHPDHDRVWLRINSSPLHDESGRLVATVVSFEDITIAKAAHEAELRFNEELERRVTERTAALAAANEELRVFSATVSHDLRAPVRAVAGFSRLLQKRYGDQLEPEAAHWVDNLVVAGETMGRLIEDFLAYARFGAEGLHMEPVELGPIMDWLRSTLVERIAESGATLRVEEPLATPVGDPAMIRRMLLNLVDNALAYARPGVPPDVVVSALREGDGVVVAVADNGRGIEPAALERIFEVFARVEPDQDLAHAGMGLAMVRKAARAMGTEVNVTSTIGEGTTFWFSLPAARPEREA